MGQRYEFSVDEKKYPEVPYIIKYLVKGEGRKLSEVVCVALVEHFRRTGTLLPYLNRQYGGGELSFDELMLYFEAMLPSIAEPLGEFHFTSSSICTL